MRILVADIGGTNARFAIADIGEDGAIALGKDQRFPSVDYRALGEAAAAFAAQQDEPLPEAAGLAIAAPVRGSRIEFPNSDWVVEPVRIADQLRLSSHVLINDLVAAAYAVDEVTGPDLVHLAGPQSEPRGEKGVSTVVGVGTGLGVAMLYRENGRRHALPTEGGHSGFAPVDEFEDRLLHHLRKNHDRVSVERVTSGMAMRPIMEILASERGEPAPAGNDRDLWASALNGDTDFARDALGRFLAILGTVCGDIALTHGPGPVILAGGLGQRLAPHIASSRFGERFAAKGRYAKMMKDQPVYLIAHPEPGLLGAAVAYRDHRLNQTPTKT
ncbi:hypothetical protein B5C34_10925 [Pacificimonas flava]|uniref:Glucokinase n=2 Tax=Pacificimonas TaxID=1960290 RepID=A0A219B6X4_9SPHN|nr:MULTISPECIES: glucokinase [Pacificimonas]MBZ6378818.1 glucokinase [Pacificimonas aurantium]OWV33924.1 hypothetical protein B5C34_10925 [Pacificimonas flava]